MPIEIKEIIIRTRIEEPVKMQDQTELKRMKNEILQECMKILKNKVQKPFEP